MSLTRVFEYVKQFPWRPHLLGLSKSHLEAVEPKFPGQKVKFDQYNIHYEMIGHGDHKVILIPGVVGTSRTDFWPLMQVMNKEKFTLLAIDPPGYGFSRPPERTYPDDYFWRDARVAGRFMEVLGHKKYSVLGWSSGGVVGLILASLRPAEIYKLVVWGAVTRITDYDAEHLKARRDYTKWSKEIQKPLVDFYGTEYLKQIWEGAVDKMVSFNKVDHMRVSEILKDIKCPTLILHGERDPLIDPIHPGLLNEKITNSRLHRFEKGRHHCHMQFPEIFNEVVEKFLLE